MSGGVERALMKLISKKELAWIDLGVGVEEVDLQSLAPFKASFFEVSPNMASPVDAHSVKEIWIVLKGEGELTVNHKEVNNIQLGDIIYFDSFESHLVRNTSQNDLRVLSLWWENE